MMHYKLIVVISCFAGYVFSKTTIMVVLGCAMNTIQEERVYKAINYVENTDNSEIVWFLTGGVKNAVSIASTEAQLMKEKVENSIGKIIIDDKAKNTAENFAYLKSWILETYNNVQELPEIVITTSEFHKERASRIFNGIFYNMQTNPLWNLSENYSCGNCWNDEKIHMRNVDIDINTALRIIM